MSEAELCLWAAAAAAGFVAVLVPRLFLFLMLTFLFLPVLWL